MSPIIQSNRGTRLVFKSGSPEGSANSSYISRSKLTGRMLYFKGIWDMDTFVSTNRPDYKYSKATFLSICGGSGEDSWPTERIYLKAEKQKNKVLHLCQKDGANAYYMVVQVYELDPKDFNIYTLTWNNKPILGDFLTEVNILNVDGAWTEFPMGTTGAIVIKKETEGVLDSAHRVWRVFYSSNYFEDKTKRPYFTDE